LNHIYFASAQISHWNSASEWLNEIVVCIMAEGNSVVLKSSPS